jgi:serine/threonine protein kinase
MSDPETTAHIRIPGYRIKREIGRGGIATVYLAVQESLDREVALKVMSPVLVADSSFTERFIGEGRMVAQLNHPGIVTIFDIAAENLHTYIAMEYLSGGSLREKLSRTMPEDTVLSIVRRMANALACAHDNGIVHRDVKPENIMFRENGAPVLTDFGIAKTVGSDARLTRTGIVVGTPRYISPEQAEGRGTDPRSDLYSLGIILFEMLAGKPPYGANDSIALLYAHVNDPIPDLPKEHRHLQPLVNATMAKDPDQRVSDCHKLSDMIYVVLREVRRGKRGAVSILPPVEVDNISGGSDVAAPQAGPNPRNIMRPFVIGSAGVLLVALLLAAGLRTVLQTQSESELADIPEPESISSALSQPEPAQQVAETRVAPALGTAGPDSVLRMQSDAEVENVAQSGSESGQSSESSTVLRESPIAPMPTARLPAIDVSKTESAPDPPKPIAGIAESRGAADGRGTRR